MFVLDKEPNLQGWALCFEMWSRLKGWHRIFMPIKCKHLW